MTIHDFIAVRVLNFRPYKASKTTYISADSINSLFENVYQNYHKSRVQIFCIEKVDGVND